MECRSCGRELRPDSKFCSECGTAVAVACANCSSVLQPGDRFCGQCGSPVAEGIPRRATSPVVQPPTLDPGERRVVSVLFVDLVGFTPLTESRDSEEVRNMLTQYFDRAQETVERFGGLIEKYIGDAVMAVWGARLAQEDDAERTVRAGLELIDAVRALGSELAIEGLDARAGILTGEAMVGGGGNDSTGMVVGDIVNSAARLQSIADAGAVLVGGRTYELTRSSIQYLDAGARVVKGKAEPISCWQALRVVSGRRGEGKSDVLVPPFVGREDEIRLLKDQLHAAGRDGRVRLVTLIGQGGIGKSRLVEELNHYIDGLADVVYWHQGRSPSYGDGLNYWAIGEMVRRRCGIAETDDDHKTRTKLRTALAEYVDDESDRTWLEPRLCGLLGLAETPPGDRTELFAAWRSFFEWVARRGTTVMVFEDAQWADEGTLDFIEDLAIVGSHLPVLVIVLARPELLDEHPAWAAGRTNTLALRLSPLSDGAVVSLVTGVVPNASDALLDRVVERAAGIPLYAVEFIRSLVSSGALQQHDGDFVLIDPDAELVLPDSLRGVIGARIDQLDTDDRELLQAAAILGHSFTLTAISSLMDRPERELESALQRFVRQDLLELDRDPRSPERGQYRFVQSVVREVAHGRISRAERTTRHLQVARYYRSLGVAELAGAAATHYVDALEAAGAADETIRAEAVAAIEEAARRAAALGAHAQAVTSALQGVDIARDQRLEAQLLSLATTSASAGLIDGGEEYGRRAIDLAREVGDASLVLAAAAALGKLYADSNRGHLAVEVLVPALETEGEMDQAERARALAELARGYMLEGEHPRGLTALDEGLAIAERLDLEAVAAGALNTRGMLLVMEGRRREGTALVRASLELAESHDLSYELRRALNNLSYLSSTDEPRKAVEFAERRLELARRVKRPQDLFDALDDRAGLYQADGRWADAARLQAEMEAMELPERQQALLGDHRRFEMFIRGDVEAAWNLFEELVAALGTVDYQIRNAVENGFAVMEMARGDVAAAFDRLMDLDDPSPNLYDVYGPLHCAMHLRDPVRLQQVRDRFDAKVFRGRFIDSVGALIDAAFLAMDGRLDEAGTAMTDILELWDGIFWRLWTAVMRAQCARLLGTDHPAGRRLAEIAQTSFVEMGAAVYLDMYADLWRTPDSEASAAG